MDMMDFAGTTSSTRTHQHHSSSSSLLSSQLLFTRVTATPKRGFCATTSNNNISSFNNIICGGSNSSTSTNPNSSTNHDTINNMNQEMNNDEWTVSTITGTDYEGYGSDSESANQSTPFSSPSGIAVNSSSSNGNGHSQMDRDSLELFISDYGNNKIRRMKSGIVTSVAGCGQKGFNGDGYLAVLSKLNYPTRIARCENGDLLIADRHNHRIRKVSALDGSISTIAGTGREGYNGDGIPAIHADLYFPTGIAIDEREGEIFISDFHNHRIRRISLRNGLIHTVAGIGEKGYDGDGGFAIYSRLRCPTGIAVNQRGDVYFSDSGNNVIRKISTCGIISTVAGSGERGCNGLNQIDALDANLNNPSGIAIGNQGEIYFADLYNNRICKVSTNGMLTTIAGGVEEGYQDGPVGSAKFKNPSDVAIDRDTGDIYVVDGGNNVIRKIFTNRFLNSGVRMRKYDWDCCNNGLGTTITTTDAMHDGNTNTMIHAVKYLVKLLSPQFYELVLNDDECLKNMSTIQHEIVQYLIDDLIYDPTENWQDKYDPIDILSVLGLFQGCEFIELKKSLVKKVRQSCSQSNIHSMMEKIDNLIIVFYGFENVILNQVFDYCIRFAGALLRESSIILQHPIILKHITEIAHHVSVKTLPHLCVQENMSERKTMSSLFNDKTTSDVIIVVDGHEFYCHKTILASNSNYFEEIFSKQQPEVLDLKVCRQIDVDTVEMVLKFCYDMLITSSIKPHQLNTLLNHANKFGIDKLSDFCKIAMNKK